MRTKCCSLRFDIRVVVNSLVEAGVGFMACLLALDVVSLVSHK